MAAWTELPPTGGLPECAALVQLAERLRWSAAELVIQYATRALAESAAEGGPLAVRAQALVAAALVRLGRHAEAVEPALVALRDADQAGVPELIPAIRLDLAACAHGLGESLLGCTILRPVLEHAGGRPSTRAIAITALVGCTAHVGRRDDLEDSLAEAERLLAADDALTPDARRMERAQLAMRTAAYYRRYGETEDAVDAARNGLNLLTKLRDPRLEGGLAKAGLVLELVCALLDDGELAEAERVAEPLLAEPVRSASAAAIGRLMLAVVTRVHIPAGRVEHGRSLLGHAAWIAERHDHDWLLADAHTAIAQLDEVSGNPADALQELRAARVAEQRRLRRVDAARRQLMIEFGVRPMQLDTVNSLLRNVVRSQIGAVPLPPARPPAPADTDKATDLLTREELSRRIQAVRSANRPVALTLVRLDPVDPAADQLSPAAKPGSAPDALTTLAGRVRDIAPQDAELARSDGSELAVLLPHTTRDEAEEFAATIRESAIESDWLEASGHEVSLSTGVAQSGPATDEDADSLLTAARETLTTADPDRPTPSTPADTNRPSRTAKNRGSLGPAALAEPDRGSRSGIGSLGAAGLAADTDRSSRTGTDRGSLGAGGLAETDRDSPGGTDRGSLGASGLAEAGRGSYRTTPSEFDLAGTDRSGRGVADRATSRASGLAESDRGSRSGADRGSLGAGGLAETDRDSRGGTDRAFSGAAGFADADRGSRSGTEGALLGAADLAGTDRATPSESDLAETDLRSRSVPDPATLSESDLAESYPSGPVAPDAPAADDLFLSTLQAAAGETGAGYQEIRELLAPLLGHPSLKRTDSAEPGESRAERWQPLPQDEQQPPDPGLPWYEQVPPRSSASDESELDPTVPLLAKLVDREDVAHRQTIPSEPEEEPENVPEPPKRPNVTPKRPDTIPEFDEPDSIPAVPPTPGPLPEVPPPATIPAHPEPKPTPKPEPEPEPQQEPENLDTVLGPVQGPEPRPDDMPHRSLRRPDRSETTSIADLLTEALVAYQETTDDEDPPTDPAFKPVDREVSYATPPTTEASGRHRMPDWDGGL